MQPDSEQSGVSFKFCTYTYRTYTVAFSPDWSTYVFQLYLLKIVATERPRTTTWTKGTFFLQCISDSTAEMYCSISGKTWHCFACKCENQELHHKCKCLHSGFNKGLFLLFIKSCSWFQLWTNMVISLPGLLSCTHIVALAFSPTTKKKKSNSVIFHFFCAV